MIQTNSFGTVQNNGNREMAKINSFTICECYSFEWNRNHWMVECGNMCDFFFIAMQVRFAIARTPSLLVGHF